MAARGVHFAITDVQRFGLESQRTDIDRISFVQNEIESLWDTDFLQETDHAWDAIHRCLGEFPPNTPWFYPVDPSLGAYALPDDYGTYPLKLCVLGGRRLMNSDENYFIRLIEPEQVIDLVPSLEELNFAEIRDRYHKHCKGAWPEFGNDDLAYTWDYFQALRAFFQRMAGNGRTIIFTADQ